MKMEFPHRAVNGKVSGLVKEYVDLRNQLEDVKSAIRELNLEYHERQDSHAYQILHKEEERITAELSLLLETRVNKVNTREGGFPE